MTTRIKWDEGNVDLLESLINELQGKEFTLNQAFGILGGKEFFDAHMNTIRSAYYAHVYPNINSKKTTTTTTTTTTTETVVEEELAESQKFVQQPTNLRLSDMAFILTQADDEIQNQAATIHKLEHRVGNLMVELKAQDNELTHLRKNVSDSKVKDLEIEELRKEVSRLRNIETDFKALGKVFNKLNEIPEDNNITLIMERNGNLEKAKK